MVPIARQSRALSTFALIFLLPLPLAAEELTSPRHVVRLATYESGAPPDVAGDKASATVPFDFVRSGERYAGQVTFSFPEKISGPLDQAGNFIQTRVTGQVTLTFKYTTRSFSPPTTLSYSLYGVVQDDAVRPPDKQCVGPSFGKSVTPGVHDVSYTLNCTWERVRVCPPDQRPSCTIFNTFIRFVTGTYPSSELGGFDLSVFSEYSFGEMAVIPGVVSNDPKRTGEVTPIKITGSGFVANSTLSLGEGIKVSNVNVKSATEIEAQISEYANAREGARDVEITKPDKTKQIGKGIFYVTSLAPEIEINQGVPMKCETTPCVADHNTVVRVRLPCNGAGCETGRAAATGRLWIYQNSASTGAPRTATPPAMAVWPANTPLQARQRSQGLDALNFPFTTERLGEGTFDFEFEIDPRNPTVMPTRDVPDRARNLIRSVQQQRFRRTTRPIHVAVLVEGNNPRDVARALGSFDFLRASYPISRDLVTVKYVPSPQGYSSLGDKVTLWSLGWDLAGLRAQNQGRFTNLVLFSRHSGFTEGGATKGMTNCSEGDPRGSTPLKCGSLVSLVNIDHQDLEAIVAHEIGHTFRFGDTYVDETNSNSLSSLNPLTPECANLESGCRVEDGSMDTTNLTVSAVDAARPNFRGTLKLDLMGNAGRFSRWMTRTMWDGLYRELGPSSSSTSIGAFAEASDRILVSGIIDTSDRVTNLLVKRRSLPMAVSEEPPGGHTVEVQDGSGTRLDSLSFKPSFKVLHRGTSPNTTFFAVLADSAAARRVVVKKGSSILATHNLSANSPSVQFVSPTGGTLTGTVRVQWNASDPDGDALRHSIFYSVDGTDWTAVASNLAETNYSWNTSLYPGSSSARLRVVTSDGANEGVATSALFTLAPKPVVVSITSPFNGAAVALGQPVVLTGLAYDPQKGELDGSALKFRSDRAGDLGTGHSVTTTLPAGRHQITLIATPSGASPITSDAIVLNVYQPQTIPHVLPVIGSTPGVGGSFFKTAVQIHNPTADAQVGRFIYHVAGISGTGADPSLGYTLRPGETHYYPDLLPQFGLSGLGSVDVIAEFGGAPFSVVRVFNDAGAKGTSGMTEELFAEGDALKAGESGVLLAPIDPVRARYNIGVRTLGAGASITFTLKSAAGTVKTSVTRDFGPTYFQQTTAAALLNLAPGPSDAIVVDVKSGSAIVYGASTDNITQDPNVQISRRASFYDGSAKRVLPVVGSLAGAFGSFFRTSVQLHNATRSIMRGTLVFHPAGRSGVVSDPSLSYSLAPGETFSAPDVVAAMRQAGVGSLDLVPSLGSAPVSVVRIYNDAGAAGTSGMTEEQVTTASAMTAGQTGVLIAPPQPSKARFNIGIRTLAEGATLNLTLRSITGEVRKSTVAVFSADYFQQTLATQLIGETPLANETILFKIERGSAIVYGATTDNTTQDASMQIVQRLP